ncbi:hypothetical protein SAMN02745121_02436 [Nannocystis exedens]|uniref:Lipoprotein n=1 Tax=Nannocystis exedens TaxID=54 RepID=A0A1I1WJX9_9BACT|nr:hypothetical protein [Nannocystis exedens]PCC67800.1 hypothetical protein NAEX_00808 [Nannocystis exedens]SFD95456.1 hypothetical protein SAMN02745121_02436 [Nannocystis exedens]
MSDRANDSRPGAAPSTLALLVLALAVGGGCEREDGEEAAVAACGAAESAAACEGIVKSSYRCAWVRTVVVTGDCETVDEQRCVPFAEQAVPPACLPIRGCHGSQPGQPGMLIAPAFREEAQGATRLVDRCYAEALGYDACESGAAADAAHPACACVCEP